MAGARLEGGDCDLRAGWLAPVGSSHDRWMNRSSSDATARLSDAAEPSASALKARFRIYPLNASARKRMTSRQAAPPAYRSVGRCSEQVNRCGAQASHAASRTQRTIGIRLQLASAVERSSSVSRDTRRSEMNAEVKTARNDSHTLIRCCLLHRFTLSSTRLCAALVAHRHTQLTT